MTRDESAGVNSASGTRTAMALAIAIAVTGGCGGKSGGTTGGTTGSPGRGGGGGSMGPGAAGQGGMAAAGAGGATGTGGSASGGRGGGVAGGGGASPSDCGPGSGLDPMAPWPTMGRCYARRASTSVLSVQKPVIAWTSAVGPASDIAIGRDGTFYFARGTGLGSVLQALRPDGTEAWSVANALPSTAPTIGPDGAIYFTSSTSTNGVVWAVEPSGTVRWKTTLGPNLTYSPVVVGADGTVYAGDDGGTLTALNANGTVRFTRPGIFWRATPAVGTDGTLYVAYGAITAATPSGTQLWQTPLADGQQVWGGVALGPNNLLYVAYSYTNAFNGGVRALDAITGAPKWTVTLPHPVLLLPAVGSDGTVYVPGEYELDAVDKNGNKLWTFPVGDLTGGVAIGGDGTIYLTSQDENLYAINPNGSRKWALPVGQAGRAPVIGADGTIYLGSTLGLVAVGCAGGTCAACVPDCTGKTCGPDGCGGLCGACAAGNRCELSTRSCQPIAPPGGAGACGDTRGLQAGAPWPATGRCPTRMGRSDQLGPHTTPTIHWTYTAGSTFTPPSIAADGTIYIGSGDKKLHAVKPDGTLRWAFTAPAAVIGSPAIAADGTIYTSTADFDMRMYAIRPDGTQRWSFRFSLGFGAQPMVGGDGTVYAQTPRGRLAAIDPLTGFPLWATLAPGSAQSGPAIGPDGTAYVHYNDLSAVAPDGSVKWSQTTTSTLPTNLPIVDPDGNIYVAWDNNLYKFAPDGSMRWVYQSMRALGVISMQGTPAIGMDGSIIVPLYADTVAITAVDPATGTVRWTSRAGAHVQNSPTVDGGGWIYYVAIDNKLYALDGSGGTQWSLQLPATIYGAPALGANGVLYLSGSDSKLYAVGP